jgi:DNA end-binding protein Ku
MACSFGFPALWSHTSTFAHWISCVVLGDFTRTVRRVCGAGRISREPTAPELSHRKRRGFIERTGENQPIPRSEIVKGYEYQPEQYVPVSDEELKRITPRTSTEIQILEFVRLGEIDPVYFETSYYVAPDRAGEKPYALLYAALQKTGYVALAQIAMHRREHVAVVRAGDRGILVHTMFYANEVRKEQESKADPALVAEKELGLAVKLIEALVAKFDPEKFKDKYREQVEALIAAKIQGREVVSGQAQPVPTAPVVDIMEALKKSLAEAGKPVGRAEEASAESRSERRTPRRSAKRR